MQLILASRSPRRVELLTAAGFDFTVEPADVDERPWPLEAPEDHVARLALEKASSIALRNPGSAVVAADTIVTLDGRLLGKPVDDQDAARMLKWLSDRDHTVLTGVAVRRDRRVVRDVAATRVRFLPIRDEELEWYLETGEPLDKAGAYAIQGLASRFIDHIEGSYSNVVGLPVSVVTRLLREVGYPVLRTVAGRAGRG